MQDCKCLFWIDMHSMTCNSWDYYDFVTANPWVLANGCDNVLKRVKVWTWATRVLKSDPSEAGVLNQHMRSSS